MKERQAKKEAKKKAEATVLPSVNVVKSTIAPTVKQVTTTTTTTTSATSSLPPPTEQGQSDLKSHSNGFSAATDFRSVFENLIKVIEINNKEMMSNFSSVNGGLLASMLRMGGHSRQQGVSGSTVSGASLGVEHKHRHHHGSDGRARHERALKDSQSERAESLSDSNSDLNVDTQSSETGFSTDLVSDSNKDTASKPSVTSRTTPAKRAKSSQFELLLKLLNELESQNGRARPEGSKDVFDGDNYRTGFLIVGNGRVGRTQSWRQRLRKRHRNKS
jgi:hypothetical protein